MEYWRRGEKGEWKQEPEDRIIGGGWEIWDEGGKDGMRSGTMEGMVGWS